MIRLSILTVLIFLAAMWLVLDWFTPIPEAQQLRGFRNATMAGQKPALAPATAFLRGRTIHTPLALLVLDVSGSMMADKGFKETLAAEIFSYFFARLSKKDVPPGERTKINMALVFFPKGRATTGIDQELWDGKPWITLAASEATYDTEANSALDRVSAALDRHIGHIGGRDHREGTGTPHEEAVMACDRIVSEYRREFGADANVFAVYFTDEALNENQRRMCANVRHLDFQQVGILQETGRPAYGIVAKSPGVELIHYLWENQEPHVMIDHFLAGLRLEPANVTADFAKGFPRDRVNQLLPLVIRTKSGFFSKARRPKLMTDAGVEIPLRGEGDTYYVALDPDDSALASAQSLHLEGVNVSTCVVTLYRRAQWQLSVAPPVCGLLDQQAHPEVRLEFSGQTMPQLTGEQVAVIEGSQGPEIARVALSWDGTRKLFAGPLPDIKKLIGRSDYFARWEEPGGETLKYPFHVSLDFDVRFLDETNQKTGREIRGVRLLPRP